MSHCWHPNDYPAGDDSVNPQKPPFAREGRVSSRLELIQKGQQHEQKQRRLAIPARRLDPRLRLSHREGELFRILCSSLLLIIAVNVYADPPNSDTSIVDAAEAQRWQQVAKLANDAERMDQVQPDGMTALHWSVYWGHLPSVSQLIKAGSDLNRVTAYDVTPLSIACENGFSQIVEVLLEAGARPNHALPGNDTALMIAARTGLPESIRHLIQHGAEVDARNTAGQTALMWAAAGGHADAVDVLLQGGADPNHSLKSGFTAFLFAARQGKIEVCQRLLRAGVDINATMSPKNTSGRNPRRGMSALMLAIESGHLELAIELVRAGANPNDQRSGFAPLHAISWVRKTKRGDGIDGDPPPRGSGNVSSLEFVRQLVAMGADVNLQLEAGSGGRAKLNKQGATPFLFAARTADLPLMKCLEELGADPRLTNVDGCNALMTAAGIGVTAVDEEPGTESEVIAAINWLAGKGFDINTIDKNRETAMHGATYRLFPKVVVRLAQLGADPAHWNHKNKYGWSPFDIAAGHRPGSLKPSPETAEALRAAQQIAQP